MTERDRNIVGEVIEEVYRPYNPNSGKDLRVYGWCSGCKTEVRKKPWKCHRDGWDVNEQGLVSYWYSTYCKKCGNKVYLK